MRRAPRPAGRRERHHPHVARPSAFWLVALTFTILLFGVTLPTPLYVVYQAQWGFAAGVLTLVFAIYSLGVLAALLFFGRLSDQIGRKRVLLAALAVAVASTIGFLLANGVAVLLVARFLSGFSAGLTQGTATAALAELEPSHDPRRAALVSSAINTGAIGLGPLIAGILTEYVGWQTHLVFVVYLGCLAVATAATLLLPETIAATRARDVPRRSGSLFRRRSAPRSSRPRSPRSRRSRSSASSSRSCRRSSERSCTSPTTRWPGVGRRSLLFAVATVAQLLLHELPSRRALLLGFPWLLLGLGLLMLGLDIRAARRLRGGDCAAPGSASGSSPWHRWSR